MGLTIILNGMRLLRHRQTRSRQSPNPPPPSKLRSAAVLFCGVILAILTVDNSFCFWYTDIPGSKGIRWVQLYYPHPEPSNDMKKVCTPHKHVNLHYF